jgi:hypothetical protein
MQLGSCYANMMHNYTNLKQTRYTATQTLRKQHTQQHKLYTNNTHSYTNLETKYTNI